MMDDISNYSRWLLEQWELGNQNAATRIFDRYVGGLVRLVSSKLAANLRVRFDPEDVMQAAFREFFDQAARHKIVLQRIGKIAIGSRLVRTWPRHQ